MPHPDHEINRIAWNEMVQVHINHPAQKRKEFVAGWNSLKEIELQQVGDVSGKTLLHLMCQFGMDTLSWARLGAVVTGVDISDDSIEHANRLKREVGIERARFVRSDLLDLIGKLNEQFDVVFQSYGTLCWLADLVQWSKVVAHHMKPDGIFFVVDDHPIITLYETEEMTYLDKRPERYSNHPDYCDRSYTIHNELVEHQHPLSEIVNCLIDAGLTIERLDEYDKGYYQVHDDWYQEGDFWYPPGGSPRYPLMFSLRARKSR